MGIIVESTLGSSNSHINEYSAHNSSGLLSGASFSPISTISITEPASISGLDQSHAYTTLPPMSASQMSMISLTDDLGYKDPLAMGDLVTTALGMDTMPAIDYSTLSTLATQSVNFDSLSALNNSLYSQPYFQIDLPPPMSPEEWDAYMEREYGDDDPSFFEWVGGGIDVAYTAVGDATVWTIQKTLGDDAVSAMAADGTYFDRYADAGDQLMRGEVFEAYKNTAMTSYFGAVDVSAVVIENVANEEWLLREGAAAERLSVLGTAIEADMRRFDRDTWGTDSVIGRGLNFSADAGDVYWQEGAGKYAEIYLWQGMVKNGVGYTIEGFVNLPTLLPELAATGLNLYDGGQRNWQLYSHDIGRDFADVAWYNKSGIGGRYVAENKNQAALLGFGSTIGDFATIPVGGSLPIVKNLFSRTRGLRILGPLFEPLSKGWTAIDMAQTTVMSPFTMSNIMDEHQEAELKAKIPGLHPEQVYDYLLKNRFSDVQIPEGAGWEDKHNLYVGAMTQYLIEAGENAEKINAMDWQSREHIYRQYDDILNDIGGALAPQIQGPTSHLDPSPIQTDVKMRGAFGAAHDHVIADASAEAPAQDSVIAYIGPHLNVKTPAA